jgi:hypothetical protein
MSVLPIQQLTYLLSMRGIEWLLDLSTIASLLLPVSISSSRQVTQLLKEVVSLTTFICDLCWLLPLQHLVLVYSQCSIRKVYRL